MLISLEKQTLKIFRNFKNSKWAVLENKKKPYCPLQNNSIKIVTVSIVWEESLIVKGILKYLKLNEARFLKLFLKLDMR